MQAVSATLELFGRISGISAVPATEASQTILASTASTDSDVRRLLPDIVEVREHESQEGVVVRIPQDNAVLHISHERAEPILRALADYYGYELQAR